MSMTTVLVICLALIPIAVGIVALEVSAASRKIIGRRPQGTSAALTLHRVPNPNLPA